MARWNIDNSHSSAEFSVRHMMITTVKGRFCNLSGWVDYDEANPANSSVEAVIETASIDTRDEGRDNHLRSADFFDAENYPTLTFKSKQVKLNNETSGKITGGLTIRGVTREVTFDVEYFGQQTNPWGKTIAGFSGKTKINREDYGLTWNVALETGGVLVGKDINIHVELQTVKETVVSEAAEPAAV